MRHVIKKLSSWLVLITATQGLNYLPKIHAESQTVLDISKGNIYISSDTVNGYNSLGELVLVPSTNGYKITDGSDIKEASKNNITISSGTHNITLSNVNISAELAFSVENAATINLTLEGTNKLKSTSDNNAALQVSSESTIFIKKDSTGSLNAAGGSYGAGIGAGNGSSSGNIIIDGGTVTAVGGIFSAGIGGGYSGSGGNVIISGGTVNAIAGEGGGAGIGGGLDGKSGTFATTEEGNAFISVRSSDGIAIQDQSSKKKWSGVIFEGNFGKVYNSPTTLEKNAEILPERTLNVESDQSLILGANITLKNSGTLNINGVQGTLNDNYSNIIKGKSDQLVDNNGTFTISALSEEMVLAPNLVYTGKNLKNEAISAISIDSNLNVTRKILDKDFKVVANKNEWDLSINNQGGSNVDLITEVGTYSAVYTNKNFPTTKVSKNFSIEPAKNFWVTPLSIKSWTYGDPPNTPVAEAQFGSVKFKYSSDENGPYTDRIPKDAGTWYVKAIVQENNCPALESTQSFTINKAHLSIKSINAQSKTYDGTDTAKIEIEFEGLKNQDMLDLDSDYMSEGVFSSKGTETDNTVTLSNLALSDNSIASNYEISYEGQETTTASIAPKEIVPIMSGTASKVYDGTNSVDTKSLSIILPGIEESDDVTATAENYTYASPEACDRVQIDVSGIKLSGKDAKNYKLSTTELSTTGTILPKPNSQMDEEDINVKPAETKDTATYVIKIAFLVLLVTLCIAITIFMLKRRN